MNNDKIIKSVEIIGKMYISSLISLNELESMVNSLNSVRIISAVSFGGVFAILVLIDGDKYNVRLNKDTKNWVNPFN